MSNVVLIRHTYMFVELVKTHTTIQVQAQPQLPLGRIQRRITKRETRPASLNCSAPTASESSTTAEGQHTLDIKEQRQIIDLH